MTERFILYNNRKIYMRILSTYTGLAIPNTISKKKKPVEHPQVAPDGETTQGVTKAGTTIYVEGENVIHRKRALQYFLKVYNNDFSTEEQKKNGNLVYKLTTRITKMKHVAAYAGCKVPNKTERKKYHVVGRKIYILGFSDSSSKMEADITHELIHIRKYANNKLGKINHNEQKIDFESVGRMTEKGLKQTISKKTPWTGSYYDVYNNKISSGNKDLAKLELPLKEKLKIASDGMIRDRKLLTGRIITNIVGNTAVERAEKLFPKSFLNQKLVLKK